MMMNLFDIDEFTPSIIHEFNKIADEIVTETGIKLLDVRPNSELNDNGFKEIVSNPQVKFSKLRDSDLKALGKELAIDLKEQFTNVIKRENLTEMTSIEFIQANRPELLQLGWVAYFMAR